MKKGDLIKFTTGIWKGKFATTTADIYSHRFMDQEDWDMVANGMGEYAGVFGSAFNVVFSDGGTRNKIRTDQNRYIVINENERSDAKEA